MLRPLGASRFDTAYVDVRKVHRNVPLIEYGAVRYSVPPDLLGQAVEMRREVDSDRFVVRWAGTVVAIHQMAAKGTVEVWDPEHRRAAERAALMRRRPHLTVVPQPVDESESTGQELLVLEGDYGVDPPDLDRYRLVDTSEGGDG